MGFSTEFSLMGILGTNHYTTMPQIRYGKQSSVQMQLPAITDLSPTNQPTTDHSTTNPLIHLSPTHRSNNHI